MEQAGITILLVDDEADILEFLSYNLEKEGYQVLKAKNGKKALKLAAENKPQLIILDVMMPDMDGYELFWRVKDYDDKIPVIMMTGFGYDSTHSIVKARQMGLQAVLYKPFRLDQLLAAVEQAVGAASAKPATTAAGV